MRLIFIRHGDPDYQNDSLTTKGFKEVKLLTKRLKNWKNITQIYLSPLGRAQKTAEPLLKKLNKKGITFDWLKEFNFLTEYPDNFFIKELAGKKTMCWDLIPDVFYENPDYFNKEKWYETPLMKKGNIKNIYLDLCSNIDNLLLEYGYKRNEKGFYNVLSPKHNPNFEPKYSSLDKGGIGGNRKEKYQLVSIKNVEEDCTLVFFCHLGVMFAIISHLIGLSPMQLWQNFYVAPTSITVLNTEERIKGQAMFRIERLGDTNHLTNGKEQISSSGYFTDVLNEL